MIDSSATIHDSSVVEEGCFIGARTRVWLNCHIRSGAVIGSDTNLGMNVYVDSGARIGSHCKIQNNVSIYRGVTLEDRVFVGPSAVFTNDRQPRAENSEWQLAPTFVRTGATIGANATIVCGVTIHEYALIAAGAVVTRDVGAYELIVGNPGRRAGRVCRCGKVLEHGNGPFKEVRCSICGREIQ